MFQINVSAFTGTLPIMLFGMAGIFIVMAVIYLSVIILLKAFADKK